MTIEEFDSYLFDELGKEFNVKYVLTHDDRHLHYLHTGSTVIHEGREYNFLIKHRKNNFSELKDYIAKQFIDFFNRKLFPFEYEMKKAIKGYNEIL